MNRLRSKLQSLDGRNYKGYKDVQGWSVCFPHFKLSIDHVQGDPYAAPSRLRVFVSVEESGLPANALESSSRRRAARDFLGRSFRKMVRSERDFSIDSGLQTVLERSCCLLTGNSIELRFRLDLPGRGRRIMGHRAADLLCRALPEIVKSALMTPGLDLEALEQHCSVVEDQDALRSQLVDRDLLAFVADGSALPRRSGIDDRPAIEAVPFISPESLRVTLSAPNAGEISGLGIPLGVRV